MSTSLKRIDSIDGLRAIACLFVIIHHVAEVYHAVSGSGHWILEFAKQVNLGRIGVLAFFAISGYVIPFSLRGEKGSGTRTFAIRRFWRLYPPLWVAIILGYLFIRPTPELAPAGFGFTMVPTLFGYDYTMGHLWTLEVELVFYILAALFYLAFGKFTLKNLAIGFGLCVTFYNFKPSLELPGTWHLITLHLAIMFWGACCRALNDLENDFRFKGFNAKQIKIIGLSASTFLILWRPLKSTYYAFFKGLENHQAFALSGLGGILLFLLWVIVFRIKIPYLATLGRATYSTYLTHSIVFYSILYYLESESGTAYTGWNMSIYILITAILSFALGTLLYRTIELPANRLGRRLSK